MNKLYNEWIVNHVDYANDCDDPRGYGKRIPYIGWYWRDTDFDGKHIKIGDCGSFIGVMENNKWDYRERCMTEEEVDRFIALIEAAMKDNSLVDKIWGWMQTLEV